MPRRILDTSVLIRHWHSCGGSSSEGKTAADAAAWARSLIQRYSTNAIVTPVYVEFLAGTRSSAEVRLAESYLGQFLVLDRRSITVEDWQEAESLSRRVPRNGKPRHLGDCLVRAIARRLRCEVFTLERSFPT